MLLPVAAALVLSMAFQASSTDRDVATQLARSGKTVEALAIFERVVAANPADAEARGWIARLQLRLGRTEEAEAGFRAVLRQYPGDVDAQIGLGVALTRRDAWPEALAVLHNAESVAGNNAELFAALARAYRRSGDDGRALEYYKQARALAPEDADLQDAYEALVRAHSTSLVVEAFGEGGVSDARSLTVIPSVRVLPRLKVEGRGRVQTKNSVTETLLGAGGIWRINRTTNLALRAAGGAGNLSLARYDLVAEGRYYRGAFEYGAIARQIAFNGVDVTAGSAALAWDTGERWRQAASYTYSWSSFQVTGESRGDHSALLRETFRVSRRVDMTATYSYGIENFADLTTERLAALGSHTLAATLQFRLPSLTTVATTIERQIRSNDSRLDRLTVTFMQGFK